MRKPFPLCAASLFLAVIVAVPSMHGQAVARGRASVRGTITAEGRPLGGVLVMRSLSSDSTRSDSLGRYAITGLAAGRHVFEVRKRGFAPIEMEINFPTDTTTIGGADIPMESGAAGDAVMNAKLDREGFLERRRRAQERDHTTFLGPDEIATREAARVSQLFENVRDVSVRFENGISVLHGGDGRCVMYVWIEHQLMESAFPPQQTLGGPTSIRGGGGSSSRSTTTRYTGLDDGLITIGQIGAIEIYPRPAMVPQEFQRSSSQVQGASSGRDYETRSAECGAVIFWTR